MFWGIIWTEHLLRAWQWCEELDLMLLSIVLLAPFPFGGLFCFRQLGALPLHLLHLHFTKTTFLRGKKKAFIIFLPTSHGKIVFS